MYILGTENAKIKNKNKKQESIDCHFSAKHFSSTSKYKASSISLISVAVNIVVESSSLIDNMFEWNRLHDSD